MSTLFQKRKNPTLSLDSIRYTPMYGNHANKGKIDFMWPQQSDMSVFSEYGAFELSHLVVKGEPGKNLLGIGLAFTNGFMSPICEANVYSSHVSQSLAYDLDLEEPYN